MNGAKQSRQFHADLWAELYGMSVTLCARVSEQLFREEAIQPFQLSTYSLQNHALGRLQINTQPVQDAVQEAVCPLELVDQWLSLPDEDTEE